MTFKVLQAKKWECCDSIQKNTWGYGRNQVLSDYLTIEEIIARIARAVRYVRHV